MSWSIKLFTIRGIPIRVHVSFLLILAWAAYLGIAGFGSTGGESGWLRGAIFMVVFTLLLFACVVLHELGHSLMAQLFGVKVHDITLWPLGGVARIARMPQRPYQEFLITAAGPTVNVILAIGLALLAFAWIGPQRLQTILVSPRQQLRFLESLNGQTLVVLLMIQNVLLALFNLIPAFPMDGGRLLRSILAAFLPFHRATRVAAIVGQGMAVLLIMASLIPPGNLFLTLVGLFVFMAAWQERQQATTFETLRGLRVRHAMQPIGLRLHPFQTLGDAVAQVASSSQSAFLVVDAGKLIGVLGREELLAATRRAGASARVGQQLAHGFSRIGQQEMLVAAQERLQEAHALVVVDDGRAVGILARGDIARLAEAVNAHPGAISKE